MASLMGTLAENLTALMNRANLNSVSLAARSGINQGYISNLRAGRDTNPTYGVLLKLCAALHCKITDLIEDPNLEGVEQREFDEKVIERAKLIESLPPNHPVRVAVDALLSTIERDTKGKDGR